MIIMIDNYDSFTYNLVHYLEMLSEEVVVYRNDAITLAEIERLKPSHILISPGPCSPNEAGISLAVIDYFKGKIPILGICLGHQAIAQSFGASVIRAKEPIHGKVFSITHDQSALFADLPNPMKVTRYHSLMVDTAKLPPDLRVTAWTNDGVIMGLEHRNYPVYGVQFHPEAILTEAGLKLLSNFLDVAR